MSLSFNMMWIWSAKAMVELFIVEGGNNSKYKWKNNQVILTMINKLQLNNKLTNNTNQNHPPRYVHVTRISLFVSSHIVDLTVKQYTIFVADHTL